jgi:uncharacterized protein YdiU (UPF0061 family)
MTFNQTYLSLPNTLYTTLEPSSITTLEEILWNQTLAKELGLDVSNQRDKDMFLNGQLDGQQSYAQSYAGHQYGHFTLLGDGRAKMLTEVNVKGRQMDIQWKGSGRTPYSRRGDGNATLESMLREYIMSEAMYHLGVPTTRTLGVFKTNQLIQRQRQHQGAQMLRVAASHIRVGTFEYARSLDVMEHLHQFLDYTIQRHFPHIKDNEHKVPTFFYEVVKQQAKLIAIWQSLGFVHGVMNTDNMAISGETIDYGPCAFLDDYDPTISFSSIDKYGRYAYGRQPYIASWNLSKLAMAILPLLGTNVEDSIHRLNHILSQFEHLYGEEYRYRMGRKLGIQSATKEDDALIAEWSNLLQTSHADFTNSFVYLTTGHYDKLPFSMVEWSLFKDKWMKRIEKDGTLEDAQSIMRQTNPIIIPRNHLIKEAVETADFEDDMTLFEELLSYLEDPYNYEKDIPKRFLEPNPNKTPFVSYCGT